jgi:type VI secretion system protein ImpJ
MFMRPHHFQAAQRHADAERHRVTKWTQPYAWGLRGLEIDTEALANYRLIIRQLSAVLPDGTTVALPEDGEVPTIELRRAFGQYAEVTIFLAVPVLNLGKANVAEPGAEEPGRFHSVTRDLEDENTGVNPQPVVLRALNVTLLLTGQDPTGYALLPILRVERSAQADAAPQILKTFIPPLLTCDAWPPLAQAILQPLTDRVGRKLEFLANQLVGKQQGRDSFDPADVLLVGQLRELNEGYAILRVLSAARGVTPFQAYLELCRLVGQLSLFGARRRTPDLPAYDHDDLGFCFTQAKIQLDALLDVLLELSYKERPFVGQALRLQVNIDSSWLDPSWDMFIGVRSTVDPNEVVRLLTVPGQLDMKVGSAERVDVVYQLGQQGLRFEQRPRPTVLPEQAGQVFFRINRNIAEREWQSVQRTLALAVRVNETRLAASLAGQTFLSIRVGGQTARLYFTLYAVPPAEPPGGDPASA